MRARILPPKRPSSPRFIFGTAARFRFDEKRDAACYLAAMIDGEGTVYVPMSGKSAKRCVQITNTDWGLIEATAECCRTLGIHFTVGKMTPSRPTWTDGWWLMISGHDNLKRVRDHVPIRAAKKRRKLALALSLYKNLSGYRRVSREEIDKRMATFAAEVERAELRPSVLLFDAYIRSQMSKPEAVPN